MPQVERSVNRFCDSLSFGLFRLLCRLNLGSLAH